MTGDVQIQEAAPSTRGRKWKSVAEREQQLVNTARRLIHEDGYHALTMNRVAERCGCSRKTVYNHFPTIDELVMEIAIQSTARRADLMARAATFNGRPRERFGAMSEIARVFAPTDLRHEMILYLSDIPRRASRERHQILQSHEERTISIGCGVVRDAIAVGDLTLPPELSPEQVVMAGNIIALGGYALAQRGLAMGAHAAQVPMDVMTRTGNLLLDDLGWKPLSHEVNWETRMETMWRAVFPEFIDKA